jgi:hypothetical protein
VAEKQRDNDGGRRWKLHIERALERRGELESGVERCGEDRGWCSPFIGGRGSTREAATSGNGWRLLALTPLMAVGC